MDHLPHSLIMGVRTDPHSKIRGQALFEFVMIIPFILVLIGTLVAIIGAINASINQVKATRNYFYMTVNNNSMFPNYKSLDELKNRHSFVVVGIDNMGWREAKQGESSLAPCFKISTFIGEEPQNEDCNTPIENSYSTFVKVKTFYGVCSGTHDVSGTNPGLNLFDNRCVMQK